MRRSFLVCTLALCYCLCICGLLACSSVTAAAVEDGDSEDHIDVDAFLSEALRLTKNNTTSSSSGSSVGGDDGDDGDDGSGMDGLVINELQHSDRAGGPDWIEIVNRGSSDARLDSSVILQLEKETGDGYDDLIRFNSTCRVSALKPNGYLVIMEDTGRMEPMPFLEQTPAAETEHSGAGLGGVCRDVRPKNSKFNCKKQKEWNKCGESWLVEGGYCAKTCGRCTPTIRNFVMETKEYTIPACKFNLKIPSSGRMRIVREVKGSEKVALGDEVQWNTGNDETLGYTAGRPKNEKLGRGKELKYLLKSSPGRENDVELSFGPLGPHWYGENPLLNDVGGTREASFKSNLPVAIVKPSGGYIPNDPKVFSHMWISSCTEYGGSVLYSDQNQTVPSSVRNRNNLICTLRDKPAYNGPVGIELRGRSSQKYPKKQYSFEFWDKNENGIELSILGMPAEEDWVLGAPYVDRSLMRDALAFDMYTEMGHWAPRMQFIELFIMENDAYRSHVDFNKHYKGIYILKEKIKRGSDRVAIQKMDEFNQTDVSGGYLLVLSSNSHDSMLATGEPQKAKVLDEGPARVSYIYPKRPTPYQQAYISNYLEDFKQTLWGDSFADPVDGYSKYIDVDSWIDYFLHTEMTKNLDGYISSVYLHKDKDGKLKAGPAWDYNLAFGQAQYWNKYYEAPHDFTYIGPNQKSYSQMVHWYYRLLQDPVFTRKLTKRYRELRQTVWRDQDIVSKIRSYTKLLSNSQHRNFQVWPINHVSTNHKYIPIKYWGNTWNENVSGLQRWVLQRLEWMDEWVPRL